MKFTLMKKEFASALKALLPITKKRGSFAILSSVLITCRDKIVSLSATDLTISMRIELPSLDCSKDEDGEMLIDCNHLYSIVTKAADDSEIEIECTGTNIRIKMDVGSVNVPTQDIAEFPEVALLDTKDVVEIDAAMLRVAIENTVYCVSSDESRPEFTGECFTMKDGVLTICATDGHRLSLYRDKLGKDGDEISMTIIPGFACKIVAKMLTDGIAKVYKFNNTMSFETDEFPKKITVNIKGIAGNFPDFERVIPEKFEFEATMLIDAIKSSCELVKGFSKNNVTELREEKNKLTLTSRDEKKGEAVSNVTTESTGADCVMGINSEYLLDAINHIGYIIDGSMILSGIDMDSPVVLRVPNSTSFTHVIMPMQL